MLVISFVPTYLRRLIGIPDLEQAKQGPFSPTNPLSLVCILGRESLYCDAGPVLSQIEIQ
jgi:hypothetical protein